MYVGLDLERSMEFGNRGTAVFGPKLRASMVSTMSLFSFPPHLFFDVFFWDTVTLPRVRFDVHVLERGKN